MPEFEQCRAAQLKRPNVPLKVVEEAARAAWERQRSNKLQIKNDMATKFSNEPIIPPVDLDLIAQGVRLILEGIGEDPERAGLKETPQRVAEMYAELTSGMREDPHAARCASCQVTSMMRW